MSSQAEKLPEYQAVLAPPAQRSNILLRLFSRRWILATLLVLGAMAVMARLGIWQLDRLEQRRAFNARVNAQLSQPSLNLTGAALSEDLASMEYREVVVEGEYDFSQQVALRNQAWGNQAGVHLLTPLRIAGTDQYVLVNRGWVPVESFDQNNWTPYDEPGKVRVEGVIRASSSKPDYGRRADPIPAPGTGRLEAWNFANVEGIDSQTPYQLLPIYIQQAPSPDWGDLPHRTQPELDLSEGPHQGYAMQWFAFAAILGVGYLFFIRRQESSRGKSLEKKHADQPPAR